MRSVKIRLVLPLALAATVIAAAACSKSSTPNPIPVHDDVYVTGQANNRILVDGDTAWIVNSLDDTVDAVDLTTCTDAPHSCQRAMQAHLPQYSNPYDEAMAGGKLWVSGLFSNALYGIDPATATVTTTITTGAGFVFANPESIFGAGSTLLVSNAVYGGPPDYGALPGYVSFVEGTAIVGQAATSEKIPVGFSAWPDGSVAVVDNTVADFSSGTGVATTAGAIDLVDPNTMSIADSIDLGLTLPGPIAAVTEDGKYAFVGSGQKGEVLRVDIATGAVDTIDFAGSETFVSDVLVDGGNVYALSFLQDRIYAFDAHSLAPVVLGSAQNFVTVGPGGSTPKGPNFAAVWNHAGEKHLLVLLTLSNSMTDVVLP